jgi:hypothetical protein
MIMPNPAIVGCEKSANIGDFIGYDFLEVI